MLDLAEAQFSYKHTTSSKEKNRRVAVVARTLADATAHANRSKLRPACTRRVTRVADLIGYRGDEIHLVSGWEQMDDAELIAAVGHAIAATHGTKVKKVRA